MVALTYEQLVRIREAVRGELGAGYAERVKPYKDWFLYQVERGGEPVAVANQFIETHRDKMSPKCMALWLVYAALAEVLEVRCGH
jgi:hypothetical protein